MNTPPHRSPTISYHTDTAENTNNWIMLTSVMRKVPRIIFDVHIIAVMGKRIHEKLHF